MVSGALDPIEDDVRTVSESDNNSTHRERYRELSIVLGELINAVIGHPAQANAVLEFLVKQNEMLRSNEAYEKERFEEVCQSYLRALTACNAVAPIRPHNISTLATRSSGSAPRESHSGRPRTKRLKSSNESQT